MDYENNTYLAVTLDSSSPFKDAPQTLSSLHPSIVHEGQVGALEDVRLVSVPKEAWAQHGGTIVTLLRGAQGVKGVNVQALKQRTKRG